MLRRTLLILLVLILIAAAINFPLAMLCDHSRTSRRTVRLYSNLRGSAVEGLAWPIPTPHDTPWPPIEGWDEYRSFGYRYVQVHSGNHQMEAHLVGWPFPCIARYQMWWPWNDPQWTSTAEPDPRPRILWSGAIGNPAILGGGVWLILLAPIEFFFLARRHSRLKRRACPGCGYPSGAAPICTECGEKLPAVYFLSVTPAQASNELMSSL